MRYIKKSGTEPEDLQKYKRDCRRASPPLKITYKDMPKDGSRKQLAVDQGYICAYCMRRICLDPENKEQYINIEHIVPQNQLTDEEATTFSNFIGVCPGGRSKTNNAGKTCDAYRGTLSKEQQIMQLNPHNEVQMETICYQSNGEIYSTDAALSHQLSEKLNLNGESTYLKQNRKTAYQNLIKALEKKKAQGRWSKLLLKNMWNKFCEPDETGAYREYVGVYEYWLKRWINK